MTLLATFDWKANAPTLKPTQKVALRVDAWVTCVEDLSGVEPADADCFTPRTLPDTVHAPLREAGRTYVPVMLANMRVATVVQADFSLNLHSSDWTQRTFPHQAECLRWLRRDCARLSIKDRTAFDRLINGTVCSALFDEAI